MIKITEYAGDKFKVKHLRDCQFNGVFKPEGDPKESTRRIILNASLGIFHIVDIFNDGYNVLAAVNNLWDEEVLVRTNDKVTIEF